MERVGIGLAGCGSIAQGMHLPGIAQMREMGKRRWSAWPTSSSERAQAVATRFPGPRGVRDDRGAAGAGRRRPGRHHHADPGALRRLWPPWRPASTATPRSRWPPRWMRPRRCWTPRPRRGRLLALRPRAPGAPVIQTIRRLAHEGAIRGPHLPSVQASHDGAEKPTCPATPPGTTSRAPTPSSTSACTALSLITSILGPVRRLACLSGRTQPERTITAGPYARASRWR